MRKALLLSLWMPAMALGSTVYSFSEPVANRGTVGFTYTAPDYLTESRNYISAEMFTNCDTSGIQGWVCDSAWLNGTNYSGTPSVQVVLNLRYAAGLPGDAFNTDEINESFLFARLDQDGGYQSFLNPGATFTIVSSPAPKPSDSLDSAAAPEPGTSGMLAEAGIMLMVLGSRWRAKKLVRVSTPCGR
jgi:hypothetical protein